MKFILAIIGLFFCTNVIPSEISGLIINQSSDRTSESIIRYLTPRWHFSSHAPIKDLKISDKRSGPASNQLEFSYADSIIMLYSVPKARIKDSDLKEVADDIYLKVVKKDAQIKSSVIKRIIKGRHQ